MFWSTGVARRLLILLAVSAAGAAILLANRRGEVWHIASDEQVGDEGP